MHREMAQVDPFARWRALQTQSNDRSTRLDDAVDLAFWTSVAHDYDRHSLAVRRPEIVARVIALAGPGASVLDLGCGTGGFAVPLAAAGCRVTAVDYSPAMLGVLAEKLAAQPAPVAIVEARLETADLPPHDVVLVANALYRVRDIQPVIDRLQALARRRVIVVWSIGRAPGWKQAARDRIRPGRYQPGVDYPEFLAALWAAGIDVDLEIFEHAVEERHETLDAARLTLVDWEQPTDEELTMAEREARSLFSYLDGAYIRQSSSRVALMTWRSDGQRP
jgi:SAM-dependent methyltransferase